MAVPVVIPALVGMLGGSVASLTGRVLLALGIGLVSFTGLSTLLNAVKTQVQGSYSGLPTLAIQIMSTLQFDTCLNIMLSAYASMLIVKGISGGKITKMIFKS